MLAAFPPARAQETAAAELLRCVPDDLALCLTVHDLRGHVGPIGGIRDKVVAAEHAGATIFLAPAEDMNELAAVDTGAMKVISVATFGDALQALRPGETAT